MFDFSEWLKAGIIDGYHKGYTPFVKVTEMTATYLAKGFITNAQANEIGEACPAPVYKEAVETEQAGTDAEE